MNPLLVILNPRRIPEALEGFDSLQIDKAWVTGYRECELAGPFDQILQLGYDPLVVVSDDVVCTQGALDAVLDAYEPDSVTTGYCNLDGRDDRVNLCRNHLAPGPPGKDHYDFFTMRDLVGVSGEVVRSTFAGMCLTAMSRELWERFPLHCYGVPGYGCDYSLSHRLGQAGIEIRAPKASFVWHLKERWSELDSTPGRELRIGVDRGVRLERLVAA